MKKFTIFWQLMMILALSSSVLLVQAQKNVSAERAPDNYQICDEQLKILTETGFTSDQLKILETNGIDIKLLQDKDYIIKAEEILGISSTVIFNKSNGTPSPSDPVSVYTFDQTIGTFIPITGGTILGTTTSDDQYFIDPAVPQGGTTKTGPGFPIGFNFDYNGYTFDVFGINNNGWMALGQTSLSPSMDMNSTSGYTPLSSVAVNTPDYLRSRIAAMGRDIQAQAGAELRIETIGTEPDRILVVQWIGYKKYGTSGTGDNFNFQIRLYETLNVIELVYGTVTNNATSTTVQVGLGGSVSSDFFNRTTTTDWNATTAGVTNTAACTISESVFPSEGLTFIFNPPPAGSPGSPINPIPANGAPSVAISTNLTWDFGSLTETYDLYFDIVNPPLLKVVDNAVAGVSGLYDPPTDLNYSIPYYWQVVARNSSKLETVGPVWYFSTECGTIIPPFYEDFTTYTGTAPPPACWLEADDGDPTTGPQSIGTSLWLQDNFGNVPGSSNCPKVNLYFNNKHEWLITPHFDLSVGNYEAVFDIALTDWNNSDPAVMGSDDQMMFLISPDAGTTWTILQTWDVSTPVSNVGETVHIPLLGYNQTDVVFAFWANDGLVNDIEDYDFFIDNLNVQVPPTCPQPIALSATFIAATSADLLWTSFSGLSDIEFGLAGFPPTGIPTYSGVVSPFNVTGLSAVTDYSFYVRDDCGGGDVSLWTGPYTFTTQPSCPQPFDLGAANVTMTSADLIWTSFSGLSDVEFGPSGFVPTGIPTYTGVASPYNVSGLNSASPYDFYVRDDCGGGDYSFWTGPFTFLTNPGSQTLPVVEDFESGFVYFNNAAGNNADWSINNAYYHSGAQCAINVYGNSQTNILHETGIIDLSAATIVWLDFWQIAKTEGNYDHCIIEVSTDGGLNYTPLPLSTYTGSGNYHVPTANAPYEICFDEDSYTLWGTGSEIPDNSTWWQHETFDLSDYLTSNVRIRFRLHTDGSIIRFGWLLDDILIYEPAYGTLAGTVTNAANSNPIEGAQISVGLLSTLSGTDGTYSIPGVLTGTWNALCTKSGFNPVTASVTIVENQTTTQDFVLTEPAFVVTPLIINDTLEPNQLLDDYVNVSNPGLGTVDWSAGVVVSGEDGTDALFDLLFDWPVGVGGGEAGIECDGNYIYTTKWNGSEFYKYDLTGTYIGPFTCGAAGSIRDLAYNGTYFYGAAAATTVFEMDFTTQTVVSSFTAPIAVRALAYNEDDDVFYGNNWSDAITMFNSSGTNLGSFPCGPIGTDYYGFAYDNVTAGAPYLWGYAQTGTTLNELIQIQLPSGVETGVQFDVGSVAAVGTGIAGGLAITGEVYPGYVILLGTSQNVDIWGLELVPYGPQWLTIEPSGGTLGASANEDMTLHFNATDLLPGVYEAEIHFTTDPDVGSPIVDVTMVVEGLIPPVNLTAGYECTNVNLGWEMPTGGTPDSWNIYRDGVLLANSTTMSFTDEMVMPEVEYGYYVRAVYAGEESMPSATESITVPVPPDLEVPFIDGNASGMSAIIEWEAPTGCLVPDGYNLYRDDAMINTSLITELTYTDPDLESGFYEYYATAVYYFGESDPSDPTYVLIVGIEEVNAGSLQVYPNPVLNSLNINSGVAIQSIRIYNNTGNLIQEIKINALYYNLDVSNFDSGIYYLGLTTSEGNISRKITVR